VDPKKLKKIDITDPLPECIYATNKTEWESIKQNGLTTQGKEFICKNRYKNMIFVVFTREYPGESDENTGKLLFKMLTIRSKKFT
jgi:hypothetical protein